MIAPSLMSASSVPCRSARRAKEMAPAAEAIKVGAKSIRMRRSVSGSRHTIDSKPTGRKRVWETISFLRAIGSCGRPLRGSISTWAGIIRQRDWGSNPLGPLRMRLGQRTPKKTRNPPRTPPRRKNKLQHTFPK